MSFMDAPKTPHLHPLHHSHQQTHPVTMPALAKTSDEETPLLGAVDSPYSAFSGRQKKWMIVTAALASTFSPFSANIYYPAMNSIAKDLHVGAGMINLTIMTYMIFQGLAPTFVGSLSEFAGRRPVYIICFTIYIGANIGLALQNSYLALLIFRAVQSSGSSGTVALATAVAADLVTSSERGKYMGLASLGSILGPTLGPILGGVLSQYLGWKSIFWFLTIFASVFFVPLLFFYPETCRNVVGDGSIPPPTWNKSWLNFRDERQRVKAGIPEDEMYALRDSLAEKRHIKIPNPLTTLKLLFELPTGLILVCNGIVFAGYYFVTSSVPSQFQEIYGLNDMQVGLLFIAPGIGTPLSAWANGHLVDWNFRRIAAKEGVPVLKGAKQSLSNYPIEKARLQIALPMLYAGALTIAAYGWLIHLEAPIAAPIVFLFLIGFTVTASFNVMNILIVDLNYSTPATATAANNLVRCFLGAASTAMVHPVLNTLGRGLAYTAVAAVWMLISPILLVIYKRGFVWRKQRAAKKS